MYDAWTAWAQWDDHGVLPRNINTVPAAVGDILGQSPRCLGRPPKLKPDTRWCRTTGDTMHYINSRLAVTGNPGQGRHLAT